MIALAAAFTIASKPADAYGTSGYTVVQEAKSWLGTPYVWGGESRYGVDCSGLVKAVFRNLGVSLPHSTWGQIDYGTSVAQPGPGDLVFSNYGYGYSSHVGIATGDGYMINAPYPGTVVRYDQIQPSYVNAYKSIF
jgi:cell wall-associated NlpC family hydrolase